MSEESQQHGGCAENSAANVQLEPQCSNPKKGIAAIGYAAL